LAVPVIVTGTFQNPQFAPDLQKVAQMKLRQLVPTADNPGQLTIGILGRILERQKPQPSKDQESPPEERRPGSEEVPRTLPDVLDRIFGGIQRPDEEKR
jgi:hypothetical protein